jgi:hypothetical protein
LILDGQTLPQRDASHVSKIDIEVKARKTTETFTIERACNLAPLPMEVQMNGFYVLLSKMDKIMDRTMVENSKEAMALLMKMETEDG